MAGALIVLRGTEITDSYSIHIVLCKSSCSKPSVSLSPEGHWMAGLIGLSLPR